MIGPEGGDPGDEPDAPAGRNPLPDKRCIHSMPDTPPDSRDRPVIDADKPPPVILSTLYLRKSAI